MTLRPAPVVLLGEVSVRSVGFGRERVDVAAGRVSLTGWAARGEGAFLINSQHRARRSLVPGTLGLPGGMVSVGSALVGTTPVSPGLERPGRTGSGPNWQCSPGVTLQQGSGTQRSMRSGRPVTRVSWTTDGLARGPNGDADNPGRAPVCRLGEAGVQPTSHETGERRQRWCGGGVVSPSSCGLGALGGSRESGLAAEMRLVCLGRHAVPPAARSIKPSTVSGGQGMPGGSGVWGVPGIRDEASWQGKAKTAARITIGSRRAWIPGRSTGSSRACLSKLGFSKSAQVAQPSGRSSMTFACQASLTRLAAIPARKSGMGKNGKMQDSCLSHGSQSRAGHIDGCNGRAEERGHLTEGLSRGRQQVHRDARLDIAPSGGVSQSRPRPWPYNGSTASVNVKMNDAALALDRAAGWRRGWSLLHALHGCREGKERRFWKGHHHQARNRNRGLANASGAWLALSPN